MFAKRIVSLSWRLQRAERKQEAARAIPIPINDNRDKAAIRQAVKKWLFEANLVRPRRA